MRTRYRLSLAVTAVAAVLVGTAVFYGHRYRTPELIVIPDSVWAKLRPGDLVFRLGTELVSNAITFVDDGAYSHVGMLVPSKHGWKVLQAVPANEEDKRDAVILSSLAHFKAPDLARAIAFYHVQATSAKHEQAANYARQKLGMPFGFESGKTYCTKLVWAAWQEAGVDLKARFTRIDALWIGGKYLLPSGLRQSPRLHLVWRSQR